VRHDHGSVYLSEVFQDELRFLDIVSSPAFVRETEGNGDAERLPQTFDTRRGGATRAVGLQRPS
jgi:hypothetical protein